MEHGLSGFPRDQLVLPDKPYLQIYIFPQNFMHLTPIIQFFFNISPQQYTIKKIVQIYSLLLFCINIQWTILEVMKAITFALGLLTITMY